MTFDWKKHSQRPGAPRITGTWGPKELPFGKAERRKRRILCEVTPAEGQLKGQERKDAIEDFLAKRAMRQRPSDP